MYTYGIKVEFKVETYKEFVHFWATRFYYFRDAAARDFVFDQLVEPATERGWKIERIATGNSTVNAENIVADVEESIASGQYRIGAQPASPPLGAAAYTVRG